MQNVMKRFPDIELSYDKTLHKKVHANCYSILPKGVKCVLWFTYQEDKNIPLLITFDRNNQVRSIKKYIVSFSDDLCYGEGTLLHGVLFKSNNISNFACTDVIIYKNQRVFKNNFASKFNILNELFAFHISNQIFSSNFLSVGLPITVTSFKDAISTARTLPYNVHSIRLIKLNYSRSVGQLRFNQSQEAEAIFKVKAQIQQDIYSLFSSDFKKAHGVAAITDYKTSVMMNTLFRNIKENRNLDLLEMSDDEDEFEDVSEDKYVDTQKIISMKCVYIPRFKKWKPISIAKRDDKVFLKSQIINLERKNTR
uniref:mRNA capping enzyme adenylation domain-containing protein n=1 Tax=viral metagenome TaxID=1070528 RepID=A0A6C0CP25_9ZZZZ